MKDVTKICKKCNTELSIDQFPVRGNDGRILSMCRPCYLQYERDRSKKRRENPEHVEKVRARSRAHHYKKYAEDPDYVQRKRDAASERMRELRKDPEMRRVLNARSQAVSNQKYATSQEFREQESARHKAYWERRKQEDVDFLYNYYKDVKERKDSGELKVAPAEARREYSKRGLNKYPEKNKSRNMCTVPKVAGIERHHWNYGAGYENDVIEMTYKDHKRLHTFIVYDKDSLMYRRKDTGELLDSNTKHYSFWVYALNHYM